MSPTAVAQPQTNFLRRFIGLIIPWRHRSSEAWAFLAVLLAFSMTVIQLIINLLHHHHQPTTKNYNLFLALIIIINVKLKMRAHSSQSEISEGETKRNEKGENIHWKENLVVLNIICRLCFVCSRAQLSSTVRTITDLKQTNIRTPPALVRCHSK